MGQCFFLGGGEQGAGGLFEQEVFQRKRSSTGQELLESRVFARFVCLILMTLGSNQIKPSKELMLFDRQ